MKWFLSAGLTSDTPASEWHKVYFLNRLILVCFVINIAMVGIDAALGLHINALANLLLTTIYVPLFYLHHKGHYFLVRNLFTGIMIVFISGMAIGTFHQDRWTETENILFAVFAGTAFLYQGKQRIVVSLVIAAALFVLKYYKLNYFQGPPNAEYTLTLINSSITFVGIYFFMYVFQREFYRSLSELVTLNNDLESQREKLENNEKRLNDLLISRDKLFSIVAHDLKNPVNLLNGLIYLAEDEEVDREQLVEHNNQIRRNLQRANEMMDNVLWWAKTQLDGYQVSKTRQDLGLVMEEILILYDEMIKAKRIQVTVEVPSATFVTIDFVLLKIVVRNVIHNAIKFTPIDGRVRIKVVDQLKGSVTLIIEDSGVGLDAETATRVLNGQFPETAKGTRSEGGTGTGLVISCEMLRRMGGDIQFEKAEPQGTSVRLTLPTEAEVTGAIGVSSGLQTN